MFSSIKESFVGIYTKMKSIVMGVIVLVNNWLVDKATGELLSDLNDMDTNPTFWNAVIKAGKRTLLGKRNSSVTGAVIIDAIIGIGAIGGGALAAGLGYTFSSGFMIAVIAIYGSVFAFNLILELYKNRLVKVSNETLESVFI